MAGKRAFVERCGFSSEEEMLGCQDHEIFPMEMAEKYQADDLNVIRSDERRATGGKKRTRCEHRTDSEQIYWENSACIKFASAKRIFTNTNTKSFYRFDSVSGLTGTFFPIRVEPLKK